MDTKLLNGNVVAEKIKSDLKEKIEKLKKKGITPGLAALLIGNDPASKVYINNKEKLVRYCLCTSSW